jgi:PAS domain S-box-containing protein
MPSENLLTRDRQQATTAACTQAAISAEGLKPLLDDILQRITTTLDMEIGIIAELMPDGEHFVVRAARGAIEPLVERTEPIIGSVVDKLLGSAASLAIADLSAAPPLRLAQCLEGLPARSCLAVLIPGHHRHWGVILVHSWTVRMGTLDDLDFLTSVANVIALFIARNEVAEKAVEESQQRFARIFQVSPIALGMSTVSEGRILDVNQAWLDMFGYRREDVIGRTRRELGITPEHSPPREAAVQELRDTGAVRSMEMHLGSKSGRFIDAIVSAVPFEGAKGEAIWISAATDITSLKHAEAERDRHLELERAARGEAESALEKLRAVYTITDSAIAHSALDDLLHELLARLRRTLGVDYATVFLLSEDRKWLYVRAIDGLQLDVFRPTRLPVGIGVSGMIASTGKPLIVTDYSTVDLSGVEGIPAEALRTMNRAAMGVPLCIGEKVVGVVTVSSTPAREFTQEELKLLLLVADRVAPAIERGRLLEKIRAGRERQKALSSQLLTAQEEERRRLAVELHDELGQVLTAVKINLESLQRAPAGQPRPAALDGAIRSVDDALQRVRDIALDLRPSVLDDLGLSAALRWYVDRLARGAGVEAHLSIDAIPDLDTGLATACFRVAQEALTNVARHAQARNVWLDLRLLPDGLELSVSDDGIGFDVSAARDRAIAGASVGLLGMQERVSLAGGQYEILKRPAGGVEVRARFPVGEKTVAS